MYRDTTNAELEMYECTSNNWSQWNSKEKLKEKFGSYTRKTLDIFTTKGSYTCSITHNTESIAVWSLKPERLGITAVSREVPGRKGLWPKMIMMIMMMMMMMMIIIIIIIIIIGFKIWGLIIKTLDSFTTKDKYTWNIIQWTECPPVWTLKPEWWWSLLVLVKKHQNEKTRDKGKRNNNK